MKWQKEFFSSRCKIKDSQAANGTLVFEIENRPTLSEKKNSFSSQDITENGLCETLASFDKETFLTKIT